MANPRYDQLALGQDRETIVIKNLNDRMKKDQGVGHNHKQKALGAMDEGNGGPIELEAVDPSTVINSYSNTLWHFIGGICKAILSITGTGNIWTAPVKTLQQLWDFINSGARFVISGCVGGDPATSFVVPSGVKYQYQKITRYIPIGKKLYLKRASYFVTSPLLQLSVYCSGGTEWVATPINDDATLNHLLMTGLGNNVVIIVSIENVSGGPTAVYNFDGWEFEFSVE
jgi:hypothetical protein